MSLNGIFDPMVRNYFEKKYGGNSGGGGDSGGGGNSGSDSGGAVVIAIPVRATEAMGQYTYYDLAESLGVLLIRASEKTPALEELEGGLLVCHHDNLVGVATDEYALRFTDGDFLFQDEDVGFIGVQDEDAALLAMVIPESAAAILTEFLGIEMLPGTYFTSAGLSGTDGACLIYGF